MRIFAVAKSLITKLKCSGGSCSDIGLIKERNLEIIILRLWVYGNISSTKCYRKPHIHISYIDIGDELSLEYAFCFFLFGAYCIVCIYATVCVNCIYMYVCMYVCMYVRKVYAVNNNLCVRMHICWHEKLRNSIASWI